MMDVSEGPSTPAQAWKTQAIILTSLPMGVTLFALVGLFLRPDVESTVAGTLVTVWLVGVLASLLGAALVWRRMVRPHLPVAGQRGTAPSMDEIGRFQTGQIVAMALIEGVALLGGVIQVIAGLALPALVGVAMTWAALLVMWPRKGWYGLR